MKVNITLNDELMERVDDFAKNNYMTRSGLISISLTQYLNQQEVMFTIKSMGLLFDKIADTGSCTPEQLEQLEDLQRFSKMLIQNI